MQPIDINDPKYFCVQDGKKRKLRVANISSKDEGFYKCKVQDKVTTGKLYVARKSNNFKLLWLLQPVNLSVKFDVLLNCEFAGDWCLSRLRPVTNCR